ncbi:hypothetical protein JCM11491_004750 [Sporobolomyces phaffii]
MDATSTTGGRATGIDFDPITDAISASCLLTADNFPSLALDDPSTFALRPAPRDASPPPLAPNPFPSPSTRPVPARSEKALGKRPESSSLSTRIRLHPTKSAALALFAASNPAVLAPVAPKLALFDAPPPPPPAATAASSSSASSSSSKNLHAPVPPTNSVADGGDAASTAAAADPAFFAPNGRSLRARVVRPSYLEIPPAALGAPPPPVASTSTAPSSRAQSQEPAVAPTRRDKPVVALSDKLVQKFKRWAAREQQRSKRKRNPSGSSLSSLSSDDSDRGGGTSAAATRRRTGKPKAKRRRKLEAAEVDGDSSPLSSLDSNDDDDDDDDEDGDGDSDSGRGRVALAFPDKPAFHPLNQLLRSKPPCPPTPPNLDVVTEHQHELNPFSWAEGLSAVTFGGQVVAPTYEQDVTALDPAAAAAEGGGGPLAPQSKKRPGWEWETTIDHAALARSVSPAATTTTTTIGGASLAHPPPAPRPPTPATTLFLSVPTSIATASTVRIPAAFLSAPSTATMTGPTTTTTTTTTTVTGLKEMIPRPKTYRQIARLDWSDFHQRHKCRFTTSGAVEGVNPEGLAWESWYGIEDEPVAAVRRLNAVDPPAAAKGRGGGGLFVLGVGTLDDLSGLGSDGDLARVEVEVPFAGGMEWSNEWRFKTLEEGMGNTWEPRCRWAVRNPERKYLSSSSDDDEPETPAEKARRDKWLAMRDQRKRERKKAKRERLRKEREGSGGESELTPVEGEELSTDSDATDDDAIGGFDSLDAATIAKHSSQLMKEAAEAHNAKRRKTAGVMIECPLPNCPQRLYRSKAGSSVATHDRHYHTPSITIKYSTGVSAFVIRNEEGDFVCPTPDCGFVTKSRGTFAVHGKPEKGKCLGPPESIPKPKNYVKPKKPKKPREPKPRLSRVQKLSAGSLARVDTASPSTSAASSPRRVEDDDDEEEVGHDDDDDDAREDVPEPPPRPSLKITIRQTARRKPRITASASVDVDDDDHAPRPPPPSTHVYPFATAAAATSSSEPAVDPDAVMHDS